MRLKLSRSGSPCPGGGWAPGPLPRNALSPGFQNPLSAAKRCCFSPPLSLGCGSNSALLTFGNTKRHWHLQSAFYQRRLQRVAVVRLWDPSSHSRRGRLPFPPQPRRFRGEGLDPVHRALVPPKPGAARSAGACGRGLRPGSLPSVSLAESARPPEEQRPSPPSPAGRARGGYSRSRLSRQRAVQPRGIPRSARAPLRPSILPARLRRDAQSPRHCLLGRDPLLPPLLRERGGRFLLFPSPPSLVLARPAPLLGCH